MRINNVVACCLVLCGVLWGCAGPRVQVVHTLPAAVPLPPGGQVRPGRFEADGPGGDWIPGFLHAQVARRMDGLAGRGVGQTPLNVSGTVSVRVTDDSGTRPARRWDESTGQLETIELPYLVRTVDVRAVFAFAAPGGFPAVELETERSYVSSRDPEVRGEYGLGRGDDPARVPPAEQVTRELLSQCVETARGMVAPVEVPVALQFRRAGGPAARAGLAAVEKGDFAEAVEQFRSAVQGDPQNSALLFDLAAAFEAAGRVAAAHEHYRAALAAASNFTRRPFRKPSRPSHSSGA